MLEKEQLVYGTITAKRTIDGQTKLLPWIEGNSYAEPYRKPEGIHDQRGVPFYGQLNVKIVSRDPTVGRLDVPHL